MLEHIPNNSMYTTIPQEYKSVYLQEETAFDYLESIDYLIDKCKFVEDEEDAFNELIKHEPRVDCS